MNKSELVVNEIFHELFNNYISQRKKDLGDLSPEKLDKMYGGIFSFYQSRSSEEQEGIITFIKTIVGDTTSILLGGLDGSTDLGSLDQSFVVQYSGEEIQGSLQSEFLSKLEDQYAS